MTPLDAFLKECIEQPELPQAQSNFYDHFLNASFYVPMHDFEPGSESDSVAPLIIEAEDIEFLILFDTEEKLKEWADEEVRFTIVPGHALALMTPEHLYWALNVGAEYSKHFEPAEIAWLKEVVEKCNAAEDSVG